MKKLLVLSILLLISIAGFSQKLEVNEVDEFTGTMIKSTSWESFYLNKKDGHMAYFKISKLDDSYIFEVKLMFQPSKVFSIAEGSKMMFILNDKSIYELNAVKSVVSSRGGGAIKLAGSAVQGAHVHYVNFDDEHLEALKDKLITKVRIYTSVGYAESGMNEKDAQVVQKAIELIE